LAAGAKDTVAPLGEKTSASCADASRRAGDEHDLLRPDAIGSSHGRALAAVPESLAMLGAASQGFVEDDVANVGVAPAEGLDRLVL
jgi:hypothetical protein